MPSTFSTSSHSTTIALLRVLTPHQARLLQLASIPLPPAPFDSLRKEVDCEWDLHEEKLARPRVCTKQLTSLQ